MSLQSQLVCIFCRLHFKITFLNFHPLNTFRTLASCQF
uniref:Uncharacterized protein n=1 Tax=Rhizophora mucronata TaxID=61149 RepID=A0A2P2JP14_RHIMU